MAKDRNGWKYTRLIYAYPVAMGILSIVTNYNRSRSPDLGGDATRPSFAVLLSIIIPLIITWILATFGTVRLKTYAHSIKDSKDGRSLNYIADSLLLMLAYIVMLPMINSLLSLVRDTSFLRFAVYLGNHVPLIIMLLSSYLLFLGSKNLIGIIKQKLKPTPAFIIFSIVWAFFFLAFIWRFYEAVPLLRPVNGIPKFALPLGGLIFTYALPHLIAWTIGLLACRNLSHYASKTRGKVYKQLFKDLYRGLLLVYISIFISQIFIISTISYTGLNIGIILIYALIILATVGFLFIARGSRRLALVENSL